MDSSLLATLFFRRLLGRRFCQEATRPRPLGSSPDATCSRAALPFESKRASGTYSRLRKTALRSDTTFEQPDWQPRRYEPSPELVEESRQYTFTTAAELATKGRRPRRTKMLMRDFIEDSLYNPHYGYFTSQATIYTSPSPMPFNDLPSELAFQKELAQRYADFEDALDDQQPNDTRQLWHTPTEIFHPTYAEAMARYMVSNYKISSYPYHDLIIYELGAGNGTFARAVLDWIRDFEPDVYARTKYKIVEISKSLATLQAARLMDETELLSKAKNPSPAAKSENKDIPEPALTSHASKVEIIQRSIFSWDTYISDPCFVVALEVIDNFPHDAIRYHKSTGLPRQGCVVLDRNGEMYESYSRVLDPLAARYLRVRAAACGEEDPFSGRASPLMSHAKRLRRWKMGDALRNLDTSAKDTVRRALGAAMGREAIASDLAADPTATDNAPEDIADLTPTEYIPTRLLTFFELLQRHFPAHRLLLSDFHALPDPIHGGDPSVGRLIGRSGGSGAGNSPFSFLRLTSSDPSTALQQRFKHTAPIVQTRFQRRTVPVSTPLVRQGYFDIFFATDFGTAEDVYRAVTGKLTRVVPHEEFMRRWAATEECAVRNGENPLLSWYQNASVMMTV